MAKAPNLSLLLFCGLMSFAAGFGDRFCFESHHYKIISAIEWTDPTSDGSCHPVCFMKTFATSNVSICEPNFMSIGAGCFHIHNNMLLFSSRWTHCLAAHPSAVVFSSAHHLDPAANVSAQAPNHPVFQRLGEIAWALASDDAAADLCGGCRYPSCEKTCLSTAGVYATVTCTPCLGDPSVCLSSPVFWVRDGLCHWEIDESVEFAEALDLCASHGASLASLDDADLFHQVFAMFELLKDKPRVAGVRDYDPVVFDIGWHWLRPDGYKVPMALASTLWKDGVPDDDEKKNTTVLENEGFRVRDYGNSDSALCALPIDRADEVPPLGPPCGSHSGGQCRDYNSVNETVFALKDNSYEVCAGHCREEWNKHARDEDNLYVALYKSECYCGTSPLGASAIGDLGCVGHRCPGDQAQFCGGSLHGQPGIIVLPIHSCVGRKPPASVAVSCSPAYLGCRARPASWQLFHSRGDNSASLCAYRCLADGKAFAAVHRSECYCSTTMFTTANRASTYCANHACPGDSGQSCGGTQTFGIFPTQTYEYNARILDATDCPKQAPPPGACEPVFLGCYAVGGVTAPQLSMATTSGENCGVFCASQGYAFAGTRKSGCYCSSTMLGSDSLDPKVGCYNFACPGFEGEWCGGTQGVSVYNVQHCVRPNASAPVSSTTPAPFAHRCLELHPEKSYLGADIQDFTFPHATLLEDCTLACFDSAPCTGFSIVTGGSEANRCFLKNAANMTSGFSPTAETTSGVNTCFSTACPHIIANANIAALNLESLIGGFTVESCTAACSANVNCTGAVLSGNGNTCWLKNMPRPFYRYIEEHVQTSILPCSNETFPTTTKMPTTNFALTDSQTTTTTQAPTELQTNTTTTTLPVTCHSVYVNQTYLGGGIADSSQPSAAACAAFCAATPDCTMASYVVSLGGCWAKNIPLEPPPVLTPFSGRTFIILCPNSTSTSAQTTTGQQTTTELIRVSTTASTRHTSTTPLPAPSVCHETIFPGYYLFNGTMSRAASSGAEGCWDLCRSEPACTSAHLEPDNECRLKDLAEPHSHLVAGVHTAFVKCPGEVSGSCEVRRLERMNTHGGAYAHLGDPFAVASEGECVQFCLALAECNVITYVSDSKVCRLRSAYDPEANLAGHPDLTALVMMCRVSATTAAPSSKTEQLTSTATTSDETTTDAAQPSTSSSTVQPISSRPTTAWSQAPSSTQRMASTIALATSTRAPASKTTSAQEEGPTSTSDDCTVHRLPEFRLHGAARKSIARIYNTTEHVCLQACLAEANCTYVLYWVNNNCLLWSSQNPWVNATDWKGCVSLLLTCRLGTSTATPSTVVATSSQDSLTTEADPSTTEAVASTSAFDSTSQSMTSTTRSTAENSTSSRLATTTTQPLSTTKIASTKRETTSSLLPTSTQFETTTVPATTSIASTKQVTSTVSTTTKAATTTTAKAETTTTTNAEPTTTTNAETTTTTNAEPTTTTKAAATTTNQALTTSSSKAATATQPKSTLGQSSSKAPTTSRKKLSTSSTTYLASSSLTTSESQTSTSTKREDRSTTQTLSTTGNVETSSQSTTEGMSSTSNKKSTSSSKNSLSSTLMAFATSSSTVRPTTSSSTVKTTMNEAKTTKVVTSAHLSTTETAGDFKETTTKVASPETTTTTPTDAADFSTSPVKTTTVETGPGSTTLKMDIVATSKESYSTEPSEEPTSTTHSADTSTTTGGTTTSETGAETTTEVIDGSSTGPIVSMTERKVEPTSLAFWAASTSRNEQVTTEEPTEPPSTAVRTEAATTAKDDSTTPSASKTTSSPTKIQSTTTVEMKAKTSTMSPVKLDEIRKAVEEFLGKEASDIPIEIAEQLSNGDTSGLEDLVSALPSQPTRAAFEKLKEDLQPILPPKIVKEVEKLGKEIIPLAEETLTVLEEFAGSPIPVTVARALNKGNQEETAKWLDNIQPPPTEEDLEKLQASEAVPPNIKKAIDEWANPKLSPSDAKSQAEKDLWELGKLTDNMPKDIPDSVKNPLLEDGNVEPLIAWMEENDIDPSDEDWEEFEKSPETSRKVKSKLAEFKLRNCQGPFEGEWSQWSACPVTCGRGNKTRTRERTQPDCAEVETLFCNLQFCPVDCRWSEWGSWGSCSQSCGEGTAARYRRPEIQASEFGRPCEGPNEETKSCEGSDCVEPTMEPEVSSSLAKAGIEPEDAAEPAAFAAAAADALPFLIGRLSLEEKMALGHSLDNTVSLCNYNGVACPKEDFKTYYDESLGNCFTFNYPQPAKYMTDRPGAQTGLTILLQSQQSEYLCTSQLGGFKLMIHNQTERPFADSEGFNVAPGMTTMVSLSQVELRKQPPPYGECTRHKDPNYLYNGTHTMEGCLRSCYQRKLMHLCGCADPRYYVPDNATACGVEKKLCLDFYRNCRDDRSGDNPMDCSVCTTPCDSYQFQLTTSTGVMYESEALSRICAQSNDPSMTSSCDSDASKERNFALVKVYYERMNLVRHQEMPDYHLTNLVSDFAGVLGITMGASVVTMLELIMAAFGLVIHLATRKAFSIFGA